MAICMNSDECMMMMANDLDASDNSMYYNYLPYFGFGRITRGLPFFLNVRLNAFSK